MKPVNFSRLFSFSFLLLIFSGSVLADSDGTFCVTKDYVAVESKGMYLPIKEHAWVVVSYSAAGIGDKQVIPANDSRMAAFNCSKDNKAIIKRGELAYIRKAEVYPVLSTKSGDQINLVFGLAEDNQVINGAGALNHYFSLSVMQVTKHHQVKAIEFVTGGVRFESVH